MARVTVDDCLKRIDNRFELVLIAAKRSRQLVNEKLILAKTNNTAGQMHIPAPILKSTPDKPTVTALREISDGTINADVLNTSLEEDRLSFLSQKRKDNFFHSWATMPPDPITENDDDKLRRKRVKSSPTSIAETYTLSASEEGDENTITDKYDTGQYSTAVVTAKNYTQDEESESTIVAEYTAEIVNSLAAPAKVDDKVDKEATTDAIADSLTEAEDTIEATKVEADAEEPTVIEEDIKESIEEPMEEFIDDKIAAASSDDISNSTEKNSKELVS